MFHNVVQVIPTENYMVYVYFDDGKIVCYDEKPLLEKEAFEPLKDAELFQKTCTIMNDTLAWDMTGDRDETSCLDIDPETLYELDHVQDYLLENTG